MFLRHVIFVCVIPDLQSLAKNSPMQMFIDSQGLAGIDYFSVLRIKYVCYMIKDHNPVPNQEAFLGDIQ